MTSCSIRRLVLHIDQVSQNQVRIWHLDLSKLSCFDHECWWQVVCCAVALYIQQSGMTYILKLICCVEIDRASLCKYCRWQQRIELIFSLCVTFQNALSFMTKQGRWTSSRKLPISSEWPFRAKPFSTVEYRFGVIKEETWYKKPLQNKLITFKYAAVAKFTSHPTLREQVIMPIMAGDKGSKCSIAHCVWRKTWSNVFRGRNSPLAAAIGRYLRYASLSMRAW